MQGQGTHTIHQSVRQPVYGYGIQGVRVWLGICVYGTDQVRRSVQVQETVNYDLGLLIDSGYWEMWAGLGTSLQGLRF